jgi:type IV secretory pathway TrbD component
MTAVTARMGGIKDDSLGPATVGRHAIHASLCRPVLFLGAEPGVVIVEVAVVLGLLFVVGVHVATVGVALFYVTVVHSAVVRVTASDPQISAVYLRSLLARDYYPAHTLWRAGPPRARASVPKAH